MNNVYSLVINFFDEDNKVDYHKVKLLLANNMKYGQKKFYIKDSDLDYSPLSCRGKKVYYKNMVKLMPADSEFKIELNFNSISDIQEILGDLNKVKRDFDLVFKSPSMTEVTMKSYFNDYISHLNFLSSNSRRNFYISLNTRLLSLIDGETLIEKTKENAAVKGFVINPVYPYDFDFEKFTVLKRKYKGRFEFLAAADDFYFLNLEKGVKTVSKHLNLFPDFFNTINIEVKNNNLDKARKYQLVLNDLINTINNFGEEVALKYLLSKHLNFEFNSGNSLTKSEKLILDSEFKKINNKFVDKV
ncbi:hypothetical protein C8C77_1025 [Halanaerobium saccharolyticum]|uniref:Uncharacterized protein n=1 Tax=Halanaerobium saccharolyticum TaxID=43595 RepID=A0A4R7Z8M6_9FIRM|nr:hypothetical protein [Halanaerobium saccharolyticum]RAK08651.1 hypothetical protein C7958_10989 [Halanaerobium saccharolyticum]TDW07206.1 hypothetical protein C8C77_1025 [Halanaerobium saccharolyticum]TDX60203.1 hypothetical protein C7956_11089 [Halanaerobium saccharolyticum]